MGFSRRTLLKASAAATVLGGVAAPFVARAEQAEFTYKYANNLPDSHPNWRDNERQRSVNLCVDPIFYYAGNIKMVVF